MYPTDKRKTSSVPSDAQAREKLALYVYEYLLHVGAQKAAQTFLSEIRWEKNISLGEPPGFLHSWWCVFWDLYCASPERRETCEHSSEAKAFHDYGFVNSGFSGNGMPQNQSGDNASLAHMGSEGMGNSGPMPPAFMGGNMRPSMPCNQQPMHSHNPMMPNQQFMAGRFPGGGMRMPQRMPGDFPGNQGQPMTPDNMDSMKEGFNSGWVGPPGSKPTAMNNWRFSKIREPMVNYSGIRGGPMNSQMGHGPNPLSPMMAGMRPQWQSNPSTPMNYPSPGNFGPGSIRQPGTPVLNSQQDSSNGDNIFPLMKSEPGSNMNNVDFGIGQGNGDNNNGQLNGGVNSNDIDGIKNSPANGNNSGNGPGTPREESNEFNIPGFGGGENDQTESAAILKIKESMQEEAKRFEKDTDHPDYYYMFNKNKSGDKL